MGALLGALGLLCALGLLFSFSVSNWWWRAKIGNVRRWFSRLRSTK